MFDQSTLQALLIVFISITAVSILDWRIKQAWDELDRRKKQHSDTAEQPKPARRATIRRPTVA